MAFSKKARAQVVHPNWGEQNWSNFVDQNRDKLATGPYRTASSSPNLIAQASEILGETFDPKNYLLTHATIVASVEVEDVPNVKLGRQQELGRHVNRRWADYRIRPDCDIYINNNHDAWSREVLLKSYRTFVGAHNFCEHVQIEEQSKGRIIDAVARDIGNSVYVDILVATNLKHASLINDIKSGRMSTMSMGCFLAGTQVTMGNGTRVAIEEIVPGDLVLTHKGRVREVLNKQIRMYRGELRYIKAVGVPSAIRATQNHGFHVLRAPSVCACGCREALPTTGTLTRRMTRRFKTGHDKRLYNPNNTYLLEEARQRKEAVASLKDWTFEKIRADELRIGDFLAFPRSVGGLAEGWTTGKSRLIGYFLAEGSFLKRSGEATEIQFNFSMGEKETYVQEVVDLLRQEFPNANTPWVQDRPERNTCVVHLAGREVASWFYQHCGEYSHGKRMSQEVMALPVEFHRHLVGAWINGDGTFGAANKTLSGTTVSYDLACQLHQLLARCGIFARMTCQQDGQHIEVAQAVGSDWAPNPDTGKRPAITLVMSLTGQEPLRGFSDKVGQKTQAEQQLRVLDDYTIFPITDIQSDWYEGLVYNMEVDEDHTYVVEGVTVYNCSVTETQCTKCGHVAADETEMCEHVKYQKGNYEFDAQGRKYRIAELCGHRDLDPTGGVHFIEASWVAVPAFQGAVMRNILQPETLNLSTHNQMRSVFASPAAPPPEWVAGDTVEKVASEVQASFPPPPPPPPGGMDMGMPGAPGAPGGDQEKDPLDEIAKDLESFVLNKLKKSLRDKMKDKAQEDAMGGNGELGTSTGDDLVKQGAQKNEYLSTIDTIFKLSSSDVEMVDWIARYHNDVGIKISRDIYRTALRAGSTEKHGNLEAYLVYCGRVLGRQPTTGEAKTLIRLGQILSLRK
jgi:hypothetical protein